MSDDPDFAAVALLVEREENRTEEARWQSWSRTWLRDTDPEEET